MLHWRKRARAHVARMDRRALLQRFRTQPPLPRELRPPPASPQQPVVAALPACGDGFVRTPPRTRRHRVWRGDGDDDAASDLVICWYSITHGSSEPHMWCTTLGDPITWRATQLVLRQRSTWTDSRALGSSGSAYRVPAPAAAPPVGKGSAAAPLAGVDTTAPAAPLALPTLSNRFLDEPITRTCT